MTRKPKPPVALYSALADASRCRIVELLRGGAKPVHELADAFSISRPAISRHLRVLKTAGLVVEVKKGRENLYSLRLAKLDKAIDWIAALKGTEPTEAAPEATADTSSAAEPAVALPVPQPAATPVVAPIETAPAKPPAKPRKPKPVAQVEFDRPLFHDDAVPPAVARAEKEKAVSQMGFDF